MASSYVFFIVGLARGREGMPPYTPVTKGSEEGDPPGEGRRRVLEPETGRSATGLEALGVDKIVFTKMT